MQKRDRYAHKKEIGVDRQVLGIFPHRATASRASDGFGRRPGARDRTRLRARFFRNRAENRPASAPSGAVPIDGVGVSETTACLACVRYQYPYVEIIAARMLSREDVAAIWQLHRN